MRKLIWATLLLGCNLLLLPLAHSASTDTYCDTDCRLLLHLNGDDGSTTIIDSSYGAYSVSAYADAQIDTDQSKFGGASGLFDGTGDYLSVSNSSDWNFGTDDFTIDMWVRFNDTTGVQTFISYNSDDDFSMKKEANGNFACYIAGVDEVSTTWNPSTNTWYHIAVSRSGTDVYGFIDGVAGTTGDSSFNISDTEELHIGQSTLGSQSFNGWIDECRVSKGTAIWTSGFTPPSAEYYRWQRKVILVT